jgi:SanA protein
MAETDGRVEEGEPVHMSRRKWLRAGRWALGLATAGVLAVVGINGIVYFSGRARTVAVKDVQPAQAAIVLGAYVFPDGRVSDMVADRLEMALKLYQEKRVQKILISGDHGTVEYDEVNTMRRYLEQKGVPTEDIFMDHAGFDTYDTMYRARDVFEVKSAVVITQAFHLPRAVYLARSMGLETQGVAADRWQYASAAYYEAREWAARVKAFGNVVLHTKPTFLGPVIPITGDGRSTHDGTD